MHFKALATDYDGTLALDGRVGHSTISALERLGASGRHLFMVTGRELEDLERIFPRWDLFESVIAENGGVLYHPTTRVMKVLHSGPPQNLIDELRARGVEPLAVGRVLLATREPNERIVLDAIKSLGLELKIVFNKGAVMVLPPGVNKATGLGAALKEARVLPEDCVGVGDAENDHAFLDFCGCAVAVANALDALKQRADYVTDLPNGAGVSELIELMISNALKRKTPASHSVDTGVATDKS
jgi:hydroxymethylpyrimidine pyrophosphatase-like HAD family hydrolase